MPTFITEEEIFTASVKLVEDGEPVDGGADGPINIQAKHLADRTLYLKRRVDEILATLDSITDGIDGINGTLATKKLAEEFFEAQI